jgi:DNA-binding CsgD family transcriptional regulator
MRRSAVTIRNHVQHILRKTGAHSIPEAVARHLLRGAP